MPNPYQTTEAEGPVDPQDTSSMDVSEEVVEHLRGARPWLYILGILGAFFGVLSLFGGAVGLLANTFMENETAEMMAGAMALYVVMGLGALVPSVALIRFANSIGAVVPTAGTTALIEAMRRHKLFWVTLAVTVGVSFIGYVALGAFMVMSIAAKQGGG